VHPTFVSGTIHPLYLKETIIDTADSDFMVLTLESRFPEATAIALISKAEKPALGAQLLQAMIGMGLTPKDGDDHELLQMVPVDIIITGLAMKWCHS
jgi:hypothetical protein